MLKNQPMQWISVVEDMLLPSRSRPRPLGQLARWTWTIQLTPLAMSTRSRKISSSESKEIAEDAVDLAGDAAESAGDFIMDLF